MKRMLTKSDPFPHEKCANSNCAVCNRSDRINCKKRGVVYQINCQGNHDTPSGIYIGETARSISERMNEHLDKYQKKSQNSVFYQHMLEKHDGILHNLDLKLLASAPDDAMLRQVTEAVYIHDRSPDLNRKEEFGNSNVPRTRRRSVNESLQS